jgi:hypothetical protein
VIGAKINKDATLKFVEWIVAQDGDDACGGQLRSSGKGADYLCWATVTFVVETVKESNYARC